ncbi:fasciclin domain-containing protein [Galbibacter sp. PAP.153]|uniref:fasciclin domain-containing protein n=1 Tax=Galbibacter sp. PAP.153 TaxID=3104623 RepID=UPI003009FF1F
MKNLAKYTLILFGVVAFMYSCSDDDDSTTPPTEEDLNIVETAQSTSSLSSLVAALTKADENEDSDLIGTLSSEGSFTVFAPTNEAFQNLLDGLDGYNTLDDFNTQEKRVLLKLILQYHVIAGTKAMSGDLLDGQELETVQGEGLTVSIDGGVHLKDATDTEAMVVQADVMASNGIVHVIDKVLLPQVVIDAINKQNLVEIVAQTEDLSILEAAVIKANLGDVLSGEGPFTVFAPTNDAFADLLDMMGEDYNSLDDFDTEEEIALLKNILLYHVITAEVMASDLSEGMVETALTDNSIDLIASENTFVLGDATGINANITAVDIDASNGVAHIIDKVLLPQEATDFLAGNNAMNIVELAQETSSLSMLVNALVQADAGFVELLQGEGPFTVFAPTNDAFQALLNSLGDEYNSIDDFDTAEEKELLADILKYHVVIGTAANSSSLSDGQTIETAQGGNVTVIIDGNVSIKDAQNNLALVSTADVEGSNGIVHIIDKVLMK